MNLKCSKKSLSDIVVAIKSSRPYYTATGFMAITVHLKAELALVATNRCMRPALHRLLINLGIGFPHHAVLPSA